MATRDQARAAAAYEKIAAQAQSPEKFKKKYGGLCLKFPAMIQQNGLCQALAFLEAKAAGKENPQESEHALFLRDLAQVVLANGTATGGRLAQLARTEPLGRYQWLTMETRECAVWMKRYAEAVLRVQAGEEVDR